MASLSACEPAPEEKVPPPPAATAAAVMDEPPPPMPPPEPEEPWTSVHPTDLPPLAPPGWAKDEAERDSRGVLVASGRGEDAGNHPRKALAAAKKQAAGRLTKWLDEHEMPPQQAIRIAQTHIGTDGRAYVQLELELPGER